MKEKRRQKPSGSEGRDKSGLRRSLKRTAAFRDVQHHKCLKNSSSATTKASQVTTSRMGMTLRWSERDRE